MWIKTSKQLPPAGKKIMILLFKKIVMVGYRLIHRDDNNKFQWYSPETPEVIYEEADITCWQHLPEVSNVD